MSTARIIWSREWNQCYQRLLVHQNLPATIKESHGVYHGCSSQDHVDSIQNTGSKFSNGLYELFLFTIKGSYKFRKMDSNGVQEVSSSSQSDAFSSPGPSRLPNFHVRSSEGYNFSPILCRTILVPQSPDTVTMKEKSYTCGICNKMFVQLNSLKTHLLNHKGQKQYMCTVCGKSFALHGNLKTHVLIHTGEKPHKCGICNKGFTVRSNLKAHELIHTGQKPHICSDCGKAFYALSNLKTHERIHTGEKPYVCGTCGKGFTAHSNLKTHEYIHTGVKPHVCHVCGKAFAVYGNLKTHEHLHTDQKPFQCGFCGKGFTRRDILNQHAVVHNDKKAENEALALTFVSTKPLLNVTDSM